MTAMGKQIKINKDFSSVLLPDGKGKGYKDGDVVDLTDAEYASLPAATTRAISLLGTVADPVRPAPPGTESDPVATVALAGKVSYKTVVTPATDVRPTTSAMVIWVGGTTRPANMAVGDLWAKG